MNNASPESTIEQHKDTPANPLGFDKYEVAQQLGSLRDMIRWGVSRFYEADLSFAQGMPEALDEAVYLCLHALHLPPDFSADYFDCNLTLDERLRILSYFKQRIEKRLPAAYITHEAWFLGLSFYVDERVLIPRSPIAELIQQYFEPWIEADSVTRILDLCTGSGCIACACAYAFTDAEVVASDISADALAVAAINRENHALTQRLTLVESDLFANIPEKTASTGFDIIVSNPPYVSVAEMQTLAKEFDHEPASALEAGEDGMDLVVQILKQAGCYLSENGILVVEVGYSRPALEQRLPQIPFYWPDFTSGGEGVFLLTAQQINDCQEIFDQL